MGCVESHHQGSADRPTSDTDSPSVSYRPRIDKSSNIVEERDSIFTSRRSYSYSTSQLNNASRGNNRMHAKLDNRLQGDHIKKVLSTPNLFAHRQDSDKNVCSGNDVALTKWGSEKRSFSSQCQEQSEIFHAMLTLRNSSQNGVLSAISSRCCKMALADLLALNALDLTAPASDALLKNRKNAWVQVAGHPGSFAPAGPNTIWKKRLSKENNETVAYQALMNDAVRDIVPKFHREVEYNNEIFIEIEDLLQHFTDPSIMDIKMGTRTFLESEVKNPILRKDLYEKMINLDPDEPTPEEHEQKAITKLRYMQFREKGSSTAMLGFRIEALKMSGEEPETELKKVKTDEQVKRLIGKFLRQNADIQRKLIRRLKEVRRKFEQSRFFKNHEVIGSSILILHDKKTNVSAWLIDFAKTLQVEGMILTHRDPWEVGNHEDGYLTGIDNLIRVISEINVKTCLHTQSCETLNHTQAPPHSDQLTGASSVPTVTVPLPDTEPQPSPKSHQNSTGKRRKSEGSIDGKVASHLFKNHFQNKTKSIPTTEKT